MAKVTKSFTLDESVFSDLEKYAELDCRKNSDFLNQTLKTAFAEMKLDEGFQADSASQAMREGGI